MPLPLLVVGCEGLGIVLDAYGMRIYHLKWCAYVGWPVSGLWWFVLTIVEEVLHGSHIQQWVDLQNNVTASCCRVWGLGRRLGCIWNEDTSPEMMWRCGMSSIRFVNICASHSEGFACVTHSTVNRLTERHYRFLLSGVRAWTSSWMLMEWGCIIWFDGNIRDDQYQVCDRLC